MKKKSIPYGKQFISDQDIESVVQVLRSDFLTQGPTPGKFEDAFKEKIGAKYAVAVANGTAALHLSAIALNIKKGQKVITTPITFSASANCVKFCNGDVHFVDIDPVSYNIDLNKLEDSFKENPTICGVIPVDFAGYPVNLEQLRSIADKYGAWILEDSCHAPGGYFLDSKKERSYCGDAKYADLAIFSFHPVKHIACGEGGMITTNDRSKYERLLTLRTHGIVKKPEVNEWYYQLMELGFNYRLSDIHAALGLNQLKNLDMNLNRRQKIADIYRQELEGVGDIIMPKITRGFYHAYHLFVIKTAKRYELYKFLKAKNIFTQVHYIPLHYMPYYQNFGWKKGDLPVAEDYYNKCLSLPIYFGLENRDLEYVIESIKKFYSQ